MPQEPNPIDKRSTPDNGQAARPGGTPAPEGSEEAALLAVLPHACFVLDREWRLTYLNPSAEKLFGQSCPAFHVMRLLTPRVMPTPSAPVKLVAGSA